MKINLSILCNIVLTTRTLRAAKIMETIKRELNLGTIKELRLRFSGGCINRAKAYSTDKYGDIFVKFNDNKKVSILYYTFLVSLFIYFHNYH